jgi:hypothetical protein
MMIFHNGVVLSCLVPLSPTVHTLPPVVFLFQLKDLSHHQNQRCNRFGYTALFHRLFPPRRSPTHETHEPPSYWHVSAFVCSSPQRCSQTIPSSILYQILIPFLFVPSRHVHILAERTTIETGQVLLFALMQLEPHLALRLISISISALADLLTLYTPPGTSPTP